MAGNAMKYQYSAEDLINKLYQKGIMGDDNGTFLQSLIDNSLVYNENVPFYMECFSIDGNETKADLSDSKKLPTWSVNSYQRRRIPMADAMAPLSETMQLENEGYTTKTGSMYQWGSGLYQTSMGKLELEARLRSLNIKDQTILGGYVKSVADAIKAHNSRLSNMAAQTISKGGAYSNAGQGMTGVSAIQTAYIPSANFIKAGAKTWADMTANAECNIPEQMKKIETDFKESKGLDESFPMQWDIPYNMAIKVLMKNPYFIAEINRYIRMFAPDKVIIITEGGTNTDTNVITMRQLEEYSRSEISKIAPIHIVKEAQAYQTLTTYTTTAGWALGVAVLRPLGLAGIVCHAEPKDIAMFNSGEVNKTIDLNVAIAQGFLYVVNKAVPNGMFKAYSNDVIGSYATVLNEIDYHVVVDTTTAD